MIPKRHPHPEDNADSWLMSYADMITLLLAFFIIFVSTSEPKQDKFAAATQGMKERFGSLSLESPYDGTYKALVGLVASSGEEHAVAVERTARGLKAELSSLRFFAEGSAEIPEEQVPLLKQMAEEFKRGDLVNYRVEAEAHTSDEPPPEGSVYADNWALSSARAAKIVALLAQEGVPPTRLRALGMADSQPAVPNADAQGNPIEENRARNQRVVIRVEREGR